MKKILSLLLVLVMTCSMLLFVSCSDNDSVETLNGKTAQELYNEALNKVKGLTNYTMTAEQVITVQNQTVNQTVISKVVGEDLYVKTNNDSAPSANMEAWYVGEMFYAIMGGVKAKANITKEEYREKFMPEGASGSDALMNIPADWFVDTKFIQESENSYYIEFIVSGEEYLKYFKSTALASYVDGVDDISYKVYFDAKGNLGDIVTELDAVIEGSDTHIISTSKITSIGTTTIVPPSNTDSFQDVTGMI